MGAAARSEVSPTPHLESWFEHRNEKVHPSKASMQFRVVVHMNQPPKVEQIQSKTYIR